MHRKSLLGALAAAQIVLVGALAAVTIGQDAPVTSFGIHPTGSEIGSGTGMMSLLYICGEPAALSGRRRGSAVPYHPPRNDR